MLRHVTENAASRPHIFPRHLQDQETFRRSQPPQGTLNRAASLPAIYIKNAARLSQSTLFSTRKPFHASESGNRSSLLQDGAHAQEFLRSSHPSVNEPSLSYQSLSAQSLSYHSLDSSPAANRASQRTEAATETSSLTAIRPPSYNNEQDFINFIHASEVPAHPSHVPACLNALKEIVLNVPHNILTGFPMLGVGALAVTIVCASTIGVSALIALPIYAVIKTLTFLIALLGSPSLALLLFISSLTSAAYLLGSIINRIMFQRTRIALYEDLKKIGEHNGGTLAQRQQAKTYCKPLTNMLAIRYDLERRERLFGQVFAKVEDDVVQATITEQDYRLIMDCLGKINTL